MRAFHFVIVGALVVLAACAGGDEDKVTGDRIAVLKPPPPLAADPTLQSQPLDLPAPTVNKAWPQSMGLVDGGMGNLSFTRAPQQAWSRSIGSGGDSDAHLLSRPVSADGRVYTIDSAATVRAFALADGAEVWSRDLTPDEADEPQFGGGLAIAGGRLYATTGYGTIAALDSAAGAVVWTHEVKATLRGAPAVAGDRVFVPTADGQLIALAVADGAQLWAQSASAEPTTLLGTAVPVVSDDVVYMPYTAGELYALRVQNGRTLWQQSLAGTRRQGGALEQISDIRGSPALDSRRVYAVGNGGRTVAVDRRTGNLAWDADLGGVDTPVVAGDLLYVLENQNTLVLLDRASGRVRATYGLPRFADEEKSKHPIYWSGPVLADGALWVAGSDGRLLALDAKTGQQAFAAELPDAAWIAPVVVDRTLLTLTDDGRLTAYR